MLRVLLPAGTILAPAPEQQHHPAHERTKKEGQERENRIRVDRARSDEETRNTGNSEENEQCFA